MADYLGQAAGVLAASLVFATFYMRTMLPLRYVAIASNVAFITYGLTFGLWPIWVLHGVLFPLNILRLLEIRALVRKIHAARTQDIDPAPLLHLLTHRRVRAGEQVFARGDVADRAYIVASGIVEIPEIGARLETGGVFGEFGVLSPVKTRTASAVAATDGDLLVIGEGDIVTALYQNPAFAIGLLRLIVRRQTDNMRAHEDGPAVSASAAGGKSR